MLLEGGGTFPGNLLVRASGTAKTPITITSYGHGTATVCGGDSYGIRLLNCQYVEVRNLHLVGSGVTSRGESTNKAIGLDIYSTATTGKASGQERLDGADVGFQVDPQFRAPGGGGSIDDAARLGTLRAYDLLPSSPLAGKGLDLQRLFRIAPGPCDFHGTPLQPGMKFSLGASQDLPRRLE